MNNLQPLYSPKSQLSYTRAFSYLCAITAPTIKLSERLINQQIADQLYIGISTVKKHINHIYSKLDVKNRTQAIHQAKVLHLIA